MAAYPSFGPFSSTRPFPSGTLQVKPKNERKRKLVTKKMKEKKKHVPMAQTTV
jgi:hypothetical protein